MPDYRKLYNRVGHSQKVAHLSDFEFRVWCQYRNSADDFGVCPLVPAKFQGDNRRLAVVPVADIQAALDKLVTIGLVLTFEHQGQQYLCQWDWQDFEQLRYPRRSGFPVPPRNVFLKLSANTQALFLEHHRNISESLRNFADTRAHARNTTPNPNPNPNPNPGGGVGEPTPTPRPRPRQQSVAARRDQEALDDTQEVKRLVAAGMSRQDAKRKVCGP